MWKSLGHEPTYYRHGDVYAPATGEEIFVDFASGQVSDTSSGDIAISAKWLRFKPVTGQALDVDLTLRAVSGGLIEGDDDYWYAAPDQGYGSHLVVSVRDDWANYHPQRTVYYRSEDGRRYGRFVFSFGNGDAHRRSTRLYISVVLNSNGSNNLESFEPMILNRGLDYKFKQKRLPQ